MTNKQKSILVVAIVLVAFGCTYWWFGVNTPSVVEVELALSDIRNARDIHLWYIDNDYKREYTGDVEWHQNWVVSYNRTIVIMESYKSILTLLGPSR